MDEYQSLSHSQWECKYHVIFIPKCRRRTLYGQIRSHRGSVFRTLTEQKESRVEEGHLMPDHVHMMISIPPKYAVSHVVGFIKAEVILSFLGLGVPIDMVSWGTMLSEAQTELVLGKWWQLVAATAFMATFVTAFALLTDALRDALDPKLR